MIKKDKICLKTSGIISKSSRRDTIIVNCQLSIVNSAKPPNSNLSVYFSPGKWYNKSKLSKKGGVTCADFSKN